jgi:hypothetical protein
VALNAGLLLANGAGRIRCTVGTPAQITCGTPTTATGLLAIALVAPALYSAGLGYSSQNALAVDVGGAVAFFNTGYGFTSAGRLALDAVGPITVHLDGIPRTAAGAIACVVE